MSKQAHPNPDNAGTREQPREVSGNIYVRGEIAVKIPIEVADKQAAAEEKKDSRDTIRLTVEIVGLIFVIIYAALTAFQSWQSWRTANAAIEANKQSRDATRLDESPWINIVQVVPIEAPYGSETFSVKVENLGRPQCSTLVRVSSFRPSILIPFQILFLMNKRQGESLSILRMLPTPSM